MENVVAKGNGLSRRGRGWTGNASLRKAASPGGDDYRVDLTQEEHVFRRIIWLSVSGLAAGAEEKEGSQKREQTKGRQGLMKTSSFLLKIRSTRIWSRVDKKGRERARNGQKQGQADPKEILGSHAEDCIPDVAFGESSKIVFGIDCPM
jgi:hypothetical protein